MRLSTLAGNRRIKEQLSRREGARGLSHAYIIAGPRGSGRHTLARALAAAMVCTASEEIRPCGRCAPCKKALKGIHPDVITLSGTGEGKGLSVDQVRQLRADAHIRPNEGERKVYLLERADQMNPSAQNAMLKLLEEGPAYAAFLLLAENVGGLLQTVRSRCEELALAPVSLAEGESWLRERYPDRPVEELLRVALSCQGILGRAVDLLEQTEEGRARNALVSRLADVLTGGTEDALLEATMALEREGRENLPALLDALEGELGNRALSPAGDRRRLLRAAELVGQLRSAAQLNVNAGQLAGWLCAGMFL